VSKLLQQLADFIESRCQEDLPLLEVGVDDSEESANASPSNTSVCQIHPSLPNVDESRVQTILESLLMKRRPSPRMEDNDDTTMMMNDNDDEGHRLAFMADPKLADARGIIRKALDLWLCAQGYYPNAATTTADAGIQWQAGVVTSYLAMDRTAAECIHLFPPPHAGLASSVGGPNMAHNSLWGILSQPLLTKMGRRRMQIWVRQPLVDLTSIVQRQDAVECLVQHGIGRDRLRDEGLRNFTSVDLDRLAVRLGHYYQPHDDDDGNTNAPTTASTNTRTALELLYQLYMLATQKVPLLVQVLQEILPSNDTTSTILTSLHESLTNALGNIQRGEELAQAVLDLEAAPREFRVKSSYKPELKELQEEMDGIDAELEDCHKEMQDLWQEVSGQTGSQVRLEMGSENNGGGEGSTTSYNWQFRLPNTNDSKLLDQHLRSQVQVHRILKNGVYFSNKQLRALATKKQEIMIEYDRHQQELVLQAMKVAATYQPVIELISDIVAQLDVLAGLAHVAAYSPHGYCRPVMTDGDDDGLGIEVRSWSFEVSSLHAGPSSLNVPWLFSYSSKGLVTHVWNYKKTLSLFPMIFA
jgi:DNA mismatch repair ATPase MutS